MLRRLLPSALLLLLGLMAILAGLLALRGTFVQEREDAIANLARQRLALSDYAKVALQQGLDRRHGELVAELRTSLDPREDRPGVYLREDRRQWLPPVREHLPGTATPAIERYEGLLTPKDPELQDVSTPEDAESRWSARLDHLERLRRSIEARQRRGTADILREISTLRLRDRLPPERDIPYVLAVVETLGKRGTAERTAIAELLRDGIALGEGEEIEAVQAALLRADRRLTRADFEALRDQILHSCLRFGLPIADFAARADATRPPIDVPERLPGTSLLAGEWYLVPEADGRVVGMHVDLAAELEPIDATMRARGLLHPGDALRLPAPASKVTAIEAWVPSVESLRWDRDATTIETRHRQKSLLLAGCAFLAVALAGIALLAQARKLRFLELKSDFVATVSHELRTPLASIRLLAETIQRRVGDDPRVKDYPARILRDVDGLGFLIENILSFNRIEKGRMAAHFDQVDLGALCRGILDEPALWAQRPVETRVSGAEGVHLRADRELLRLLFANLARNAVAYNERDPAWIEVEIRAGPPILVRVLDNGIGIPADRQTAVFEEFVRGDETHGARGSGLGLALCREVMRLHGGSIRIAESSPAGTCFEMRFPEVPRNG